MDINTKAISMLTGILTSLGFEVAANGKITDADGNVIKLGGKEVWLPTAAIMQESDWQNKVAFTPFAENGLRSESAIQKRLGKWINSVLNIRYRMAIQLTVELIANEELHKTFSRKQRDVLVQIAKVGKLARSHRSKIKAIVKEAATEPLVYIYCSRKPKNPEDRGVRREARFVNDINDIDVEDDGEFRGVNLSRSEARMFKAIGTYILPTTIDYDFGSSCLDTPWSESVLKCYANVSEQLNSFFALYAKSLDVIGVTLEDVFVNLDFDEGFGPETNPSLRTLYPTTPGNEGEQPADVASKGLTINVNSGTRNEQASSVPANDNAVKLNSIATPAPAPHAAATPTSTTPSKETAMSSWAERKKTPYPAAPVYNQQATHHYQQPQSAAAYQPLGPTGRPLRQVGTALNGHPLHSEDGNPATYAIIDNNFVPMDHNGNILASNNAPQQAAPQQYAPQQYAAPQQQYVAPPYSPPPPQYVPQQYSSPAPHYAPQQQYAPAPNYPPQPHPQVALPQGVRRHQLPDGRTIYIDNEGFELEYTPEPQTQYNPRNHGYGQHVDTSVTSHAEAKLARQRAEQGRYPPHPGHIRY